MTDEVGSDLQAALTALAALGVLPNGYCFCSSNRDAKKENHAGECSDARSVLKGFHWDRASMRWVKADGREGLEE